MIPTVPSPNVTFGNLDDINLTARLGPDEDPLDERLILPGDPAHRSPNLFVTVYSIDGHKNVRKN